MHSIGDFSIICNKEEGKMLKMLGYMPHINVT